MGRGSKKRPVIFFIILFAVIVTLAVLSAKNRENVGFIDNAVNTVSKPFTKAFTSVSEFFGDFSVYFKDKKELSEKLDEYTYENNILEQKLSSLESLEDENKRLRDLLELRAKYPEFETKSASVTAKDGGNYCKFITIDKGRESGIEVNQPVISQNGLVGLVFEVGDGWAKIQTILDPSTSAGCKISRTGDTSVTEGDISLINEGLLKMLYISNQFTLLEGDIVETSGLGEIYPSGIAIGRIKEVKISENSSSQYATVSPVVDFTRLYEVLVITDIK